MRKEHRMSGEYGSDWLTQGGVDDQLVTFRNAKFACFVEAQDPTQPFLVVDIVPDDPEVTPFEEQRIGIGQGWEDHDDGARVERTDGRRPQFHASSKAGRLLTSFLNNGGRAAAQERAKTHNDTPFDASWWEGLRGKIKSNEGSFTDRESGEEVTYSYYTIEEDAGWDGAGADGGTKAKKAPAKKAATKPAAKKDTEVEAEVDAEAEVEADTPAAKPKPAKKAAAKKDGGLEAKVREHCAATEADDHDSWLMEVYADIPEVADDDAIDALVTDPDGIWNDTWAE